MQSPSTVADRRLEKLLLHHEIEEFNNAYAAALDDGRLNDWAEMFTEDAFYVVISRENADRGMPVGLVYCENKGMIQDRAFALEKTEMFAPRYLRHIIGNTQILGEDDNGDVRAQCELCRCSRCCSIGPTRSCIRSASITTSSAVSAGS